MITAVTSRPDNGAIQALEARAMAAQVDPSRDSMERDLARYSYFSPVMRIDVDTQKAVLQYRNSETGDVERQYPSKERLKAYAGGRAEAESPAPKEPVEQNAGGNETPVALVA